MRIFIFGVGQVGKSTISKELSKRLNLDFYDLDFIIMDKYVSIENYMEKFNDRSKRYKNKADLVLKYAEKYDDFVMAVSPIYSMKEHERLNEKLKDDYCFVLTANVETLFDRLAFYDEKGVLLEDSVEYKNKYKELYIKAICTDNLSNEREFSFYEQINTNNKSIEQVVDYIVELLKDNY